MIARVIPCIAVFLCLGLLVPRAAAAQQRDGDRNIVQTILADLKSVASKESIPVLSSATALALLAAPFDETLVYSASCSTFQKSAFEGWARLAGQEWLLAGASVATYVTGKAFDNRTVAKLGGDLIESQVVAGITTYALKLAIPRPRPDGEPRSFPSGHAAGTFAAATVLQRHFGLKGAVPAYTFATLISAARLQANSHYPTDIIMGAAFGILSGRAATFDVAGHAVSLTPSLGAHGGVMIGASVHGR